MPINKNANLITTKSRGFTLIELLVVIGIIFILASSSLFIYSNLQPSTELGEFSVQLTQLIRKARNLSVNGYNNSSHGVYIDNNLHQVILYQGESYITRNPDWDFATEYNSGILITTTLSEPDINFNKWTGFPKATGVLSLNFGAIGLDKQISINSLGLIDLD